MKLPRKWLICPVLFLLFGLLLWCLWGNTAFTCTRYTLRSQKIPSAFDGFQIAQISDLHNTEFGTNNKKLLDALAEAVPDVIFLTGDLIDSRRTDLDVALSFAKEASKIAPVYYSPGNHEARMPAAYVQLKAGLSEAGVVILENASRTFEKEGQSITVTGLLDPDFGTPWPEIITENYHIVLSHRPERLDYYAEKGFDLVFTGHAHGGQFRLPFVGGLFAPHQGLFPRYTSGIHTKDATLMAVSRGLGNSLFPLRFNNRPEWILVTLESF